MLKKPISLTSSFMCSACVRRALGCCGKMAEPLENMFYVKRNKTNGANISSYVPTRVSVSVHVAKNVNVQRYGD